MAAPKRVIVSACLLGHYCRYDGQTKEDRVLKKWLEDKEVIPFCPEAPLFGTPRPRINLIEQNRTIKVIRENDNADVTRLLLDETLRFYKEVSDIDRIILKSKSPSCGLGTTPYYDSKMHPLGFTDGISAKTFKEIFPSVPISDEDHYQS